MVYNIKQLKTIVSVSHEFLFNNLILSVLLLFRCLPLIQNLSTKSVPCTIQFIRHLHGDFKVIHKDCQLQLEKEVSATFTSIL